MKSKKGGSNSPVHKQDLSQAGLDTMKKALRERALRFETLIETVPVGIVENDTSGIISYCNGVFADLIGYAPADLIGKHIWELADPKMRNAVRDDVIKILQDQPQPTPYITKLARKNNRAVNAQIDWNYKRNRRGNITGLVSSVTDITERKEADAGLLESEERFRTAIEHFHDSVALVRKNKLVYVNQKFLDIFGYAKPEEVIEKSPTIVIHPDDRPMVRRYRIKRERGEMSPEEYVHKGIKKDGTTIFIEVSISETLYRGEPVAFIYQKDITERKTTEEALRKSEEKYRNIFENAVEGIFQITPEGQFLSANPALARMHGFESPDELIRAITSTADQMYVDLEDRKRLIKLLKKQDVVKDFQTKMYKKDGSIIWVSMTSRSVKDATGKMEYHEGVVEDITERREAEKNLLESEERYRTAIEHSNDGVDLVSNGQYIYVNQKFLDIFGYEKSEDVIGKRPLMTAHPDDFKKLKEYGEKRQRGEQAPERYEYKGIRKDGTTIIIEVSIAETTYRGAPVVLSYLRDITERKRTEEALKRSEERFRALVEKSSEVIILYDNDRKRLYVSPTITKVLGYTIEEIFPINWTEIVHPDDIKTVETSRSLSLSNPGETVVFTNRLRHKDGTWRWVENSTCNLLKEPGVHALVVNFHDITERKLVEEALKQNEERFRALTEKSAEVILLTDKNRKRIYVSPSITRILGYTVEEFLSAGRTEFTHPDDIIKVDTARSHILANPGESVTFIDRMRHKNGSWRWAECTIRNLLNEPSVHSLVVNFHDITERKMAEEALRESENKFKDLAEKSFVGIYISQDKVFKYVNARFAEIHGYDIEEIIDKKTSEEMIFLEDLPPVEENVLARSSGAVKSLHYEFRIVAKTGEIKYVEVYGTDTIFQSKPATIGTILDITGRKQAEEALIKSEEKYRNIFENAVEGIFQTTPEGQFLRANPALARIFGFDSPGELIASTAGMIKALYANPEDRRTMIDLIETRGSAEGFETQFLRKDGERIWVSTNGWAVHDENGRTTYYEGTITDITNRKLAEEALQESEAKYRNVVDHLIVGFYVIQDNVFRFVNRRFCEMSGYSCEELVDKINPLAIIHHDDRTIVAALLEKRMKGELDYIGSMFRGVKKDGQVIVVKGLSNMIIYDSRPAVAGTLIDITKETTLESQLRQAQKMEAVGTLAGGIAHDFNNILTVIIGYGRLLQMKMAEADPLRAYVAQMLSSAETAANLTRNLLTFSRKQIVELKSVKIGKIIKATERLLKSLLTEDIELKIISPDYDITIMADMSQIEQILLNLASNANDAMPRGGTLTIEAKEVELKNIFVDGYDYIESGKYARISVADTGTGIDEKTRNKIFEPFFTTKEVGKGTGLGLSIVHGIINQHHGYITVDSKPQGGTVFNVYFPAVKAPVEETETISPVAGGGTETILVAEDDAQVRGLTVEVLGSVGYTVIEAVDGEDAVKKFVEHSDTVGLLLLDVVMPRKNGKEAYDEIKKINPDIRVIFSSGYTGDVIIGKGIIGKEYDFIQKPLSPNELLLRIRETLDR